MRSAYADCRRVRLPCASVMTSQPRYSVSCPSSVPSKRDRNAAMNLSKVGRSVHETRRSSM
eukprot:1929525-Rhodomonas_salina.1